MKKSNVRYRLSLGLVLFYIGIAIFAPFIAGEKPIFCLHENRCIYPMIPYSPTSTHFDQYPSLSPLSDQGKVSLREKHWLGTDKLGRDTAAGLVHGARVSLMVGFVAVLFIFIIGTSLGMASAYSIHKNIRLNILQIAILILFLTLATFYLVHDIKFGMHPVFAIINSILPIGIIFYGILYVGKKWTNLKKYRLPLDLILTKIIEVRKSFPGLFLFLALAAIFAIPSVWNIIFIIAITGWIEFARHARAETLAVLETDYITSAQLSGLPHFKILFNHVLPNILPTLLVLACFSISGVILIESSLSFLGIGIPTETVTWGKMMAEGRNMQNWWMVVFPGFAIFTIILSLNNIANHFQKK
ncbi:MAG: ABC transporter permease [Chitinophagales bacterium]|nr:ABC transporter permease [Chitinophagales bacterium]